MIDIPFDFIATSDWHLGLVRYSRDTDGVADRHREAIHSLEEMVDYAITAQVSAFIVAGDLTNVNQPSQIHYADLLPLFKKLSDNGIVTYIIPGNHDAINTIPGMNSLRSVDKAALPNVYVLNKVKVVQHEGMDLVFLPHINKCEYSALKKGAEAELMLSKIKEAYGGKIPKTPKVVVGHAQVPGAVSGAERLIMRGGEQDYALKLPGVVAYFFGHIHLPQDLVIDSIPAFYMGSTQAIDFGERNDVKSFIHFKDKAVHRVPINTRKLIQYDYSYEQYVNAFKPGMEKIKETNNIVKVALKLTDKEAKLLNEDLIRDSIDCYWLEIDKDVTVTASARVEGLDADTDPDQALGIWYKNKKYSEQGYERILARHKEVMVEATTLKE